MPQNVRPWNLWPARWPASFRGFRRGPAKSNAIRYNGSEEDFEIRISDFLSHSDFVLWFFRAMYRPPASTLIFRALRLRCPRCGETKMFKGLFRMHESCPHCGLKYERQSG